MTYEILCAGELLIDFISETYTDTLNTTTTFRQFLGGSAANLCSNMTILGNRTKLVASVGNDAMGQLAIETMKNKGVDCTHLVILDNVPTTLILVTRSKVSPDFQPYRSADIQILPTQFSDDSLKNTKIFHTTCFALSQPPAQNSILDAAKKAASYGTQLSIDLNYAFKIWPNRQVAQAIVQQYCALGALVKVSEVDWQRLYPNIPIDPIQVLEFFLKLGAKQVCLTLGAKGCYVADKANMYFVEAEKLEVVDATGAGDAFWAGYLTAWLDGHSITRCALTGRAMAGRKLRIMGQLSEPMDKMLLY